MTYHKDLTPYSYTSESDELLNVGFLDKEHEFTRGPVPFELLCKLREVNKVPFVKHRGFHVCNLCKPTKEIESNSDFLSAWQVPRRGDGVIKVTHQNGKVYAAPTLILHYITDHQYLPPVEFLEAVVGKDWQTYINDINSKFIRNDQEYCLK